MKLMIMMTINSNTLTGPGAEATKNLATAAVMSAAMRCRPPQQLGAGATAQTVGPYDIVCGRSKLAFNHVGNRRFRVTVDLNMDRYNNAPTRNERSLVILSIIDLIRSNGGRFLKRKGGMWVEMSEKDIRQKVGHAIRDKTAHILANAREEEDSSGDDDDYSQSEATSSRQSSSSSSSQQTALKNIDARCSVALPTTLTHAFQQQQQPLKLEPFPESLKPVDVACARLSNTFTDGAALADLLEATMGPKTLAAAASQHCMENGNHFVDLFAKGVDLSSFGISDDSPCPSKLAAI